MVAFEHDFFISYAHLDDESLVEGEPGWVARLHRLLEIRVGQLVGEKPKIWRDPKLQGNDYFADTLLERLPRIAALVSVLSPRYVHAGAEGVLPRFGEVGRHPDRRQVAHLQGGQDAGAPRAAPERGAAAARL
jgi:hypothetical protein